MAKAQTCGESRAMDFLNIWQELSKHFIITMHRSEEEYVQHMLRELRLRGYQIEYDPHRIGGDLDYGT